MNLKFCALICMAVFMQSCDENTSVKNTSSQDTTIPIANTAQQFQDSLKETLNTDDKPINEYLTEKLKPIRENFKRINSITKWTNIITKELFESTEGGEAKFYYTGDRLEKVAAKHFGETGQQLSEYYFLNGQLSFAFEKTYRYNRPMYYDSITAKENGDGEAFDFTKSKFIEDRSYFENGRLIHQINNEDDGAPFNDEYLRKEQERILPELKDLLSLIKKSKAE